MDDTVTLNQVAIDGLTNRKAPHMKGSQVEDIVAGIGIPPQPALVTEMRANEGDLGALVRVLKGDAAVAASVVKVANSPFYGLMQKCNLNHWQWEPKLIPVNLQYSL